MNITCAILSFKSADGWTGRETDETSDLTYKKEEINLWKVAMKEQARKIAHFLVANLHTAIFSILRCEHGEFFLHESK